MKDERRKFTRLQFKEDEIEVFSDDAILFGQLNDISKGGLSFLYTPVSGEELDTNSINILPKGADNYNLYHINCQIIYDISSAGEGKSITNYEKRKCGIKYYWLKEIQNKKLELLINNYMVK